MKKNDELVKPLIFDSIYVNPQELDEIKFRYKENRQFITYYQQRLQVFERNKEQQL